MTAGLRRVEVVLHLRTPVRDQTRRAVTLLEGPAGWGEASPLPGMGSPAAALAAASESATQPFPAPRRDEVEVNALITALAPDDAAAAARRAVQAGFDTIKVKAGDADDLDRVAAVRVAVGPEPALRLDVNGRWDPDTARRRLRALAAYDIEYVEEPVAGLEALAALRRNSPVRLAADESVGSLADAGRLADLAAADVLVLKVQRCGGIRPALDWAEASGVPVVVASLLESSVGLAAGLGLAAALPELPFACGLGTAELLAADVVADPLVPVAGRLAVRRPVPDPELLARYAAT